MGRGVRCQLQKHFSCSSGRRAPTLIAPKINLTANQGGGTPKPDGGVAPKHPWQGRGLNEAHGPQQMKVNQADCRANSNSNTSLFVESQSMGGSRYVPPLTPFDCKRGIGPKAHCHCGPTKGVAMLPLLRIATPPLQNCNINKRKDTFTKEMGKSSMVKCELSWGMIEALHIRHFSVFKKERGAISESHRLKQYL
jgi:hypothetical protein